MYFNLSSLELHLNINTPLDLSRPPKLLGLLRLGFEFGGVLVKISCDQEGLSTRSLRFGGIGALFLCMNDLIDLKGRRFIGGGREEVVEDTDRMGFLGGANDDDFFVMEEDSRLFLKLGGDEEIDRIDIFETSSGSESNFLA